jgi:hypothetical protein
MLTIDREKYLEIAKNDGISAAITTLHLDTERMEFETFEGQAGYRPELFEHLKKVREFSCELWNQVLTHPGNKP